MIDYSTTLLKNVHTVLLVPENGETFLVRGDYDYWHYGCDGFNDQGWGCGYRTLQTISSWIQRNTNTNKLVPNIKTIQETLVLLEDKEFDFVDSKKWIGSFEVCLVLDVRYDVLSKVVHIPNGKDLIKYVDTFKSHFEEFGSPAMMGGDQDCSSKGIMGIHFGTEGIYLLVVDPHFVGKAKSSEQLINQHFVKWQKLSDFIDSSFYNVCFPQIKYTVKS